MKGKNKKTKSEQIVTFDLDVLHSVAAAEESEYEEMFGSQYGAKFLDQPYYKDYISAFVLPFKVTKAHPTSRTIRGISWFNSA